MTKPTKESLRDNLNVIWTIVFKDIIDAFKNKLVVLMIVILSIMLLMPKMLPFIFEQSLTMLPIYDMGDLLPCG